MGKFNNNKLIDVGYKAAGGILSSDGESNDGGDAGFAWFGERFGFICDVKSSPCNSSGRAMMMRSAVDA